LLRYKVNSNRDKHPVSLFQKEVVMKRLIVVIVLLATWLVVSSPTFDDVSGRRHRSRICCR